MNITVNERSLTVIVDKEIYGIDVLHKCFYWYGNDFDVEINNQDARRYHVVLQAKDGQQDLAVIVSKIKRDIIDFKLRDTVTKETSAIRDLIVAKAFAYYEDESDPTTELSDPVGFDPHSV